MNLSHHAYYLIGSIEDRDQIISLLEKDHGIIVQGNPDFYIRNYVTFTIDDSREIKSLHNSRPIIELNKKNAGSGKKIFVLTMNGITVEAQNSLLKLLEEPAEYAHFFIIIPSEHLLIPTVKSRLSILKLNKKNKTEIDPDLLAEAQAFIKANQTKRLDIVKALTESISKEKKTKQDTIDFINAIESAVYGAGDSKEQLVMNQKAFEAIALARNYIHDRAPSVKMLLEYVALNVR